MIATGWKSSPLIQQTPNVKRSSKNSKRSSIHRDSSEYQHHKVPNPFMETPQCMLPPGLLTQISNLEYLTPNQLQKIQWNQAVNVPRRSSVFTRHLQAMQKAARQQQQKMNTPTKLKSVCFQQPMQEQAQNNQDSISINGKCQAQADYLSQQSRHRFALQPMQLQDQGLFSIQQQSRNASVHFYSMTDLNHLDNSNWDDYFDA